MCERACVVRGALSRVLRASRLLGVTPLRFAPLRDGYSVCVWPLQLLYSYTFGIFFIAVALCVFLVDIQAFVETKSFAITTSFYPGWGFDLMFVTIHIVLNYATVGPRMREMIKTLNIIEKVKIDIDETLTIESSHRKKMVMAISLFILFSFLIIIDGYVATTSGNLQVNKMMCYIVVYMTFTSMILLEVQMVLIYFEVHAMFQLMNKKLEQLVEFDYSINAPSINSGVRSFSCLYVSGCEVVKQIDESNGPFTLQVVLNWSVYVVSTELDFFSKDNSYNSFSYTSVTILQILWLLYYVLKTAFLVEPCHRVNKEIDNMKFALSKLMYATPGGALVPLEMEVLFMEILLQEPRFEPLGIFSVNRSLITAMCGYIITYMILTIQLKL